MGDRTNRSPDLADRARIVRPVVPEDARAIAAIYAPIVTDTTVSFELSPPDETEMAERIAQVMKSGPWLVLEIEGEIVGYAYATAFRARPAYDTTRETTVYVRGDHRGSGVGHELMAALIAQLRGSGCHTVVAGITVPNPPSVALHERLGFRHVGTFHEVGRKFDRWLDVAFYELRLR
ncbi:MAG: N-acetyltransferase [Actinobacteria bacterium]|mgnify:CR=1 FL=1|nr:MAG: N-acetyltransferase [Actinomycetota bacterium]REK33562.1 MAG: N-acetyltransferase [Actinomycetota bacterium]